MTRWFDALGRGRGRRRFHAQRLLEDGRREPGDAVGHGGGKEQGLTLPRQQRDDPLDVRQEPHVEHPVGLVEHEDGQSVETHRLLLAEIEQAARRGDDDVRPARERVHLRLLADAAEHDRAAQLEVTPVGAEAVADLDGELARRREHKHVRPSAAMIGSLRKPLQDGQREGGGLAGAGLRQAEEVTAGQDGRDGLGLDGRRRDIVFLGQRAQQRLAELEFGK